MDINVLNEFVWGKERSKSLSHSGSGNETSEGKSFPATRSDGFFQRIYQQAATGIAITDWLGVLQECNPAYSALLGYTEEELRSVDFASLVHPEDREANLAQIRRLQAGEISSFDIENRYLHKNGAPVWVHKFVSVLPGENGEPGHLIALVTNTTGRHHAEQRASEARLRTPELGRGTRGRTKRSGTNATAACTVFPAKLQGTRHGSRASTRKTVRGCWPASTKSGTLQVMTFGMSSSGPSGPMES
jgi:PAS domain S-box-containing protein